MKTAKQTFLKPGVDYDELFRQFGEHSSDVFWAVELRDGRIEPIYVNPAFEKVWGLSAEVIYESFNNLIQSIHPEDKERFQTAITKLTVEKFDIEYRIIRANDGEVRWIHDRGYSVKNEQGEVYRFIGVAQDITKKKLVEQEIHEQNDILHTIGSMAKVGGWRVDLATMTPIWSEEVYRIHEVEIGHQPALEEAINFYAPEARSVITKAFQNCASEGIPYDVELPFITAKGNRLWVRAIGRAEQKNGQVTRIYGGFQDITSQKEVSLQLEEARQLAEQSSVAKTRFLANMSHEIRTPLHAIVGFSQILLKQSEKHQFSQKVLQYLEFIKLSGEHLTAIINNILDLSKIEAGKMDISEENVNLRKLVEKVFHIHQIEAQNKDIQLVYECDDQLPEIIRTDSTKLNQVLMNLTANAIKFSSKGKIHLQVSRTDEHVVFAVQDQGIGIVEEHQSVIFEAFEQAESSTTRQFGGTGLGLTITKQLVDLLGGRIWFESQVGEGTTFYVQIPLKMGNDPTVEMKGGENNTRFSSEHVVLVVEDNPLNQEMAKALFADLQMKVYLAENGKDGVEKATQLHEEGTIPDLILMDLHMPVMDGLEALRLLRQKVEFQNTPIVAVSADAFSEQQKTAIQAGFNEYLIKPLDFKKLFTVLNQYLPSSHPPNPVTQFQQEGGPALIDDDIFNKVSEKLKIKLPDIFMRMVPEELEKMKSLVEQNEFQQVGEIAHNLKGSGLAIGAVPFVTLCRKIQECAQNNTTDDIKWLLPQLEITYRDTVQYLQDSGRTMGR